MKKYQFPFSAIVGQETMKTALLLNIIDPSIGGILIRGQKGTGKSTAVRSVKGILPEIEVVEDCPYNCSPNDPEKMHQGCYEKHKKNEQLKSKTLPTPIVELPLNATEDRVAGTLHLEHALRTGERLFEPGLLAGANRGILYVDEVNLLDDHLVDILLDAAASGFNSVEREGISTVHPANFILVGTMNPEEGDLRPQFLDRFALCVEIEDIKNKEDRQKVIKHRILFEQEPDNFCQHWSLEDEFLKRHIEKARISLPNVEISSDIMELAVELSLEVNVQGHRADICMIKAARTMAALMEKEKVERSDIIEVARFVLPHRMLNSPLETAEEKMLHLEDILIRGLKNEKKEEVIKDDYSAQDEYDLEYAAESIQIPGSSAAGSVFFDFIKKKAMNKSLNPINL